MNPQTPGWRTTEFWLTVLAAIMGLVAAAGVFDDASRWASMFGYVQTALVTAGYTIARGLTKFGVATAASKVEAARISSGNYHVSMPMPPSPAPTQRT